MTEHLLEIRGLTYVSDIKVNEGYACRQNSGSLIKIRVPLEDKAKAEVRGMTELEEGTLGTDGNTYGACLTPEEAMT